ncbi:WXG100 family type VII secretion target [[Actinomadura] parvosata]|uniref:ESAT-6-like protein n=1 Tax=Nonomuraea composti TaxID=2720023 RepID=A0ABX1BLY3_9ACTN|nr:WXG100 family type VII secretion target [Nonomuraea sp. FMUSA5-5]NJP95788.1 WXG100 family type VII secretion target [Nonomuraea sp. FMUSA5-5]
MSGNPDIILANFDEMEEIAAELGRAYANLVGELTDLETDLKVLETWAGSAKDVYLDAKRQWNEAVVTMGDTMQRFGPALHDATEIMRDAENANVRRWGT